MAVLPSIGPLTRDIFIEKVISDINYIQFDGAIEIDESLLGKKQKYGAGKVTKQVWIFGIVERKSERLILQPVEDRTKSTLIPLIKKSVKIGSTIYCDGYISCCDLNKEGYTHFSVVYKTGFTQKYRNVITGEEEILCHTNGIEGAWGRAKQYFKKMYGSSPKTFRVSSL